MTSFAARDQASWAGSREEGPLSEVGCCQKRAAGMTAEVNGPRPRNRVPEDKRTGQKKVSNARWFGIEKTWLGIVTTPHVLTRRTPRAGETPTDPWLICWRSPTCSPSATHERCRIAGPRARTGSPTGRRVTPTSASRDRARLTTTTCRRPQSRVV